LQGLQDEARASLISVKNPPSRNEITNKNGIGELYALGGMTRLVSRKSTSPSSSQAGSVSPVSHPASPASMSRNAVLYQPSLTHQQPQHTQLQNLNLAQSWLPSNQSGILEANEFHPSYYSNSPTQQGAQYPYGVVHQNVQQAAPYEMLPEYYGYAQPSDDFSSPMQVMAMENGGPTPDVNMSWHNFMAQYK
jgi:hypothetical protein